MARRDQFGTSKGKYDDAFESMVHSVETRLDSSGKRIKIKDKEDLRVLFERLDKQRLDKKSKPKITKTFIDRLLETKAADRFLGKTVGRFGAVSTLKRPEAQVVSPKVQSLREKGTQVYTYGQGYATKSISKSKKGKLVVRFRSVKTGRYVRKDLIEE